MADDRHVLEACSLHQARQIVDMVSQAVAAAGRPFRLAMPAKVGRHDMKVAPQRARQMIPAARMIETAVNQEQRRGLRGTPVGGKKTLALGGGITRVSRGGCWLTWRIVKD